MSSSEPESERRFTNADWLAVCLGVLALIAGVVLLAVNPGFIASIVGVCLLGAAAVAFVALAFLLVGESEDRDYRKGAL
ncbi:MAG: hypothetical protein WAN93_07435 [Solirubrobacteraceae bacterium]